LGGLKLPYSITRETHALEDRRTKEARDLEAQRVREAALQNYFQQVGELLIEKPLRRAGPGDNLSTVVRAQTLSVLEGLDPDRERILLLFLYESGLIHTRESVVSLAAADLRIANLSDAVGLTDEQIDAADFLDDATVPNGQKYEDWLKSKGRGEDGENRGPS
jgi:hypothetical protein